MTLLCFRKLQVCVYYDLQVTTENLNQKKDSELLSYNTSYVPKTLQHFMLRFVLNIKRNVKCYTDRFFFFFWDSTSNCSGHKQNMIRCFLSHGDSPG